MKFNSKAIHVGQKPDPTTGSIIPPVHLTSTYVQEYPGVTKGYDYTRAGNPNFSNVEQTLASLENGQYATYFSSGLASITALISQLKQGDLVLATNDLYGGTFRIFTKVFHHFGIRFKAIDTQDLEEVEKNVQLNPTYLLLETPTNPLLRICDLEKISTLAKKYHVTTIIDNTFATPYFQNPLDLGIDVVLHSTTKYIGGHSDVIGGVVVSNNKDLKEKMDFARMAIGLSGSPFDAWLISRSVKTLGVRMEKHEENAFAVVNYLKSNPKVKKIYYPGLPEHKGHEIAKKQMKGFSGIVSVEFDLSFEKMKELISSFRLISLAESLGGIESLVDHPASMTHMSIPKSEREKNGLTDGLVRLSIGIEESEDIIEDIDSVLKKY